MENHQPTDFDLLPSSSDMTLQEYLERISEIERIIWKNKMGNLEEELTRSKQSNRLMENDLAELKKKSTAWQQIVHGKDRHISELLLAKTNFDKQKRDFELKEIQLKTQIDNGQNAIKENVTEAAKMTLRMKELEAELKTADQTREHHDQQLDVLNQQLREKDQEIERNQEVMDEKLNDNLLKMEDLTSQLGTAEESIRKLNMELTDNKLKVKEFKEDQKSVNEKLENQKKQLEDAEQQLKSKEQEIDRIQKLSKEGINNNLKHQHCIIKQLEEKVKTYEDTIKIKDGMIEDIQNKLSKLEDTSTEEKKKLDEKCKDQAQQLGEISQQLRKRNQEFERYQLIMANDLINNRKSQDLLKQQDEQMKTDKNTIKAKDALLEDIQKELRELKEKSIQEEKNQAKKLDDMKLQLKEKDQEIERNKKVKQKDSDENAKQQCQLYRLKMELKTNENTMKTKEALLEEAQKELIELKEKSNQEKNEQDEIALLRKNLNSAIKEKEDLKIAFTRLEKENAELIAEESQDSDKPSSKELVLLRRKNRELVKKLRNSAFQDLITKNEEIVKANQKLGSKLQLMINEQLYQLRHYHRSEEIRLLTRNIQTLTEAMEDKDYIIFDLQEKMKRNNEDIRLEREYQKELNEQMNRKRHSLDDETTNTNSKRRREGRNQLFDL